MGSKIFKLAAALAVIFGAGTASADNANTTNFIGQVVVQPSYTDITCATATAAGELCVQGDIETNSNVDIGGTATLTGNVTMTGTLDVTGATAMSGDLTLDTAAVLSGQLQNYTDKTGNYDVAVTDCGATLVTNDDGRVFTLPDAAAANLGCSITFINFAADDASKVSISPAASDGIFGTCCGLDDAATTICAVITGVDDKDIINTKATQNRGDTVTLISDGTSEWYVTACMGIWAPE